FGVEVDGGADGPLLWRRGSAGRNDGRRRGDVLLWASSRLNSEDDGPSGRRWTIACIVGENVVSQWLMVVLMNLHQCNDPSHPLSVSPVKILSMDKGDNMNGGLSAV
ncbi:hypothetical protein HAX54_035999, partial [Datura stramonium]|nr:hypothetical protein [Datura stramonium]